MTDRRAEEGANLFHLLAARGLEHPNHVATRTRRRGAWQWSSWTDVHGAATAVAATLLERGIAKGERVALFAASREEWITADFGILAAGAVTVPIYPTATAEQVAWILGNSGARIAVVEGAAQVAVVLDVASRLASLTEIIVFEENAAVDSPLRVTSFVDCVREGRRLLTPEYEARVTARARDVGPTDLATIVYTSGTTGRPRGTMLSHGALGAETRALREAMRIGPDDEQYLMLPLAHILGRTLVLAQIASGSRLAFSSGPERLIADLGETEPTFFAAVPRFFEKVRAVANDSAGAEGPLKAALWSWAVGVGTQASRARRQGAPVGAIMSARARYADRLVLRRVRRAFGKRLRFAISGGAPLARDLAEWFHACGILLLEGYGLTEVSGASHVNRQNDFRFGTVGKPLTGVEAKTAADGEVLLRSPGAMAGYFGDDGATKSATDDDGWFRTGDIGRVDGQGFLTIVDRKKDVIVTAGGSNVAPQRIEGMLAGSPFIGHAVVFGDRRPFLVALITVDVPTCARWARERKRPDDVASLAKDPELLALIQLDVDAVNQRLSTFETIKRFTVLDHELAVESGELTDTRKVRRRYVGEHYATLIDRMYL